MNLKSLLVCAFFCAFAPGSFLANAAATDDFDSDSFRVIFGVISSSNNNGAGRAIAGLSAAQTFGKNDVLEFNLEWLNSAWKVDRYDDDGAWVRSDTEHHMPVMINCRYLMRIPRTPIQLFVGGGAGFDFMSTPYGRVGIDETLEDRARDNFNTDNEPGFWGQLFYDVSGYYDASLIANAMAGATVRISKRMRIEVGYRLIWQSATTCRVYDTTLPDYRRGHGTHTSWTKQDRLSFVSAAAHFVF